MTGQASDKYDLHANSSDSNIIWVASDLYEEWHDQAWDENLRGRNDILPTLV